MRRSLFPVTLADQQQQQQEGFPCFSYATAIVPRQSPLVSSTFFPWGTSTSISFGVFCRCHPYFYALYKLLLVFFDALVVCGCVFLCV